MLHSCNITVRMLVHSVTLEKITEDLHISYHDVTHTVPIQQTPSGCHRSDITDTVTLAWSGAAPLTVHDRAIWPSQITLRLS